MPNRRRLYEPIFRVPRNLTAGVARYFDLSKFVWLIENRQLYLCQASRFNDPLEGTLTPLSLIDIKHFEESFGHEYDPAKWEEIENDFKRTTFVNCWHLNDNESIYMWQKYCPEKNGIMVESSFDRLSMACQATGIAEEKFFPCAIDYIMDRSNFHIKVSNAFYRFTHKDAAYWKEQEVRILCIDSVQPFVGLPVNCADLMTGLFVHPCASEDFYQSIEELLIENAPELLPMLCWSTLKGHVDCDEMISLTS